ncbi:MAG TPA: glycoside hydrolase family 3 N-terminal domain-containing protein [Ktedonobacterales bacterium]
MEPLEPDGFPRDPVEFVDASRDASRDASTETGTEPNGGSTRDAIADANTAANTAALKTPIPQFGGDQLPPLQESADAARQIVGQTVEQAGVLARRSGTHLLDAGRRIRLRLRRHPRATGALIVALLALMVLLPLLSVVGSGRLSSFALLRVITPSATAPRPTPRATPFGTPDPHQMDWVNSVHSAAVDAYVNSLVTHMTTDQELGQMLMIEFVDAEMTPTIAYELKQFHIGSVVLYKWNVSSADGLRELDKQLQANADGIPLLIATDQEGGYVNRLSVIDGYLPSAEEMGARNDPNYVYSRGLQDGQQLYDLGINMNMAPVVDVQSIPDDETVMGTRMFGWTPDKVTTMAGAYLAGVQAGHHVVGTLKHFPGLGDVPGDPHQESVYLNRSVAQMQAIDWAPYKALIATGQVEMIMTTHITVPALDPTLPTTLSYPITTGILRDKLGFQGVIITDGIYMHALGDHYGFDQIIVGSVLAGNDIICSTYSLNSTTEAFHILQQAVANGTITRARLDESVRRILLLKLHYGLLKMPSA